MYSTDFLKNDNNSGKLLDFFSEREAALLAVKRKSRLRRIAYVSVIAVCSIMTVCLGFFAGLL